LDLIWRKAYPPAPTRNGAEAREHLMGLAKPSSSRAVAGDGPAKPVADRALPLATLRFAHFDAGLLDRLTDDIIRRVERRVRIERERRGL
jgi:hypothetical protein